MTADWVLVLATAAGAVAGFLGAWWLLYPSRRVIDRKNRETAQLQQQVRNLQDARVQQWPGIDGPPPESWGVVSDPRVEKLVAYWDRILTDREREEAAFLDVEAVAAKSISNYEAAGLMVLPRPEHEPDEWDVGDPEPDADVIGVNDYTAEDTGDLDPDSPRWGRTTNGWKSYKNGNKTYLDWPELVRRWGPVRRG